MKALSLTQPWAMLCIWLAYEDVAEKQYETRSWRWTPKPQEILIHAAKGFPKWARNLCRDNPVFREALKRHGHDGPDTLPLGSLVGRVWISGCFATQNIRERITEKEQAFGDYSSGRLAIKLNHPTALSQTIECKGALGLWTVPPDIEALVLQYLPKEPR
jgi:hypothetical protein